MVCVDDDACIVSALVHVINSLGFQAEGAANGQNAANLIADDYSRFDMVVTDHCMPVMNGLSMVRRIPEIGYKGSIIVHCSPLDRADRAAYVALGIKHFIPKPSDFCTIVRIIKTDSQRGI